MIRRLPVPFAANPYARVLLLAGAAVLAYVGAAGHVDTAAGCGPRPAGERLLEALCTIVG